MSSGKIILLLIAMGLVGLVLFLGYKLDVYEEKRKRKEKNTKKQNVSGDETFYTEFNPLRIDYKKELNQTSTFTSTSFDLKNVAPKSNKYSEKFDKTAVIETINLSKLEKDDKKEDVSNKNEYKKLEVKENIKTVKNEVYDEEEEIEKYTYENFDNSTMVFNTTGIKNDNEIEFESIKSGKIASKSTARKTTKNAGESTKTNTKK